MINYPEIRKKILKNIEYTEEEEDREDVAECLIYILSEFKKGG